MNALQNKYPQQKALNDDKNIERNKSTSELKLQNTQAESGHLVLHTVHKKKKKKKETRTCENFLQRLKFGLLQGDFLPVVNAKTVLSNSMPLSAPRSFSASYALKFCD